jgi:hypothetical protein
MFAANGPAIKSRLCYLAQPSGYRSWYFSREMVPVARQVWRAFCRPGTSFVSYTSVAVQSRLRAGFLSPCRKPNLCTRAVSRHKFDRSQKFITVQDFKCVQMRVSGCNNHYKFILSAGAKAKSVTTCPAQRETTYPYCPCYI